MNKVIKRFESLMLFSLVMPLIDIIVGVLFLKFPEFSMKVNITILGVSIILHGLFYFIRYIYDGLGAKVFSFELIVGVIAVILGVFTIFSPFEAIKSIGYFFCGWLCVRALNIIYYGVKFIKNKQDISPLTLFIAVLMIIMGFLVAFNPFKAFMLITRLIGIFIICSGLFDGMICFLFRKNAKNILEVFK